MTSDLGFPVVRPPGARPARICLIGVEGRAPMIYALHPDASGDLRSIFALPFGVTARQVDLVELPGGRIYPLGDLFGGLLEEPLPEPEAVGPPRRWRRPAEGPRGEDGEATSLREALLDLHDAVVARRSAVCSALAECSHGYHGIGCPVQAADERISRACHRADEWRRGFRWVLSDVSVDAPLIVRAVVVVPSGPGSDAAPPAAGPASDAAPSPGTSAPDPAPGTSSSGAGGRP